MVVINIPKINKAQNPGIFHLDIFYHFYPLLKNGETQNYNYFINLFLTFYILLNGLYL